MNKPVAWVCGLIALMGMAILSTCLYWMLWTGTGRLELGNFHRYQYLTIRNSVTGEDIRDWREIVDDSDGIISLRSVDLWLAGFSLMALSGCLYTIAQVTDGKRAGP